MEERKICGLRVAVYPHGWAVLDPVPINRLVVLVGLAEAEGFTIVDAEISAAIGVVMVITNESQSNQWRWELGIEGASRGGGSR